MSNCLLLSLAYLIRTGACQCTLPAIIMVPKTRTTGRAKAGFVKPKLTQFGDTFHEEKVVNI